MLHPFGEDDEVPEDFDGGEFGDGGADVKWAVKEIDAGGETCAIWLLLFLRVHGAKDAPACGCWGWTCGNDALH